MQSAPNRKSILCVFIAHDRACGTISGLGQHVKPVVVRTVTIGCFDSESVEHQPLHTNRHQSLDSISQQSPLRVSQPVCAIQHIASVAMTDRPISPTHRGRLEE